MASRGNKPKAFNCNFKSSIENDFLKGSHITRIGWLKEEGDWRKKWHRAKSKKKGTHETKEKARRRRRIE
jgi:hypothetical protein